MAFSNSTASWRNQFHSFWTLKSECEILRHFKTQRGLNAQILFYYIHIIYIISSNGTSVNKINEAPDTNDSELINKILTSFGDVL